MIAPATCSLIAWIVIIIGHRKQLHRESDDVTLDSWSLSPTSTAINENAPHNYSEPWWKRFNWANTRSVRSETSSVTVKVKLQGKEV